MNNRSRRWGAVTASTALLLCISACSAAGRDEDSAPCADGAHLCSGNVLLTCQSGSYVATETCSAVCDEGLGCVACTPNTGTCNGSVSHTCKLDGTGYVDMTCDPVQGVTCGAAGVCEGPCAPQLLGESYIGCEYFPTVLPSFTSTLFHFAVAVSNTSSDMAIVTLEGGALAASVILMVPPHSVQIKTLPLDVPPLGIEPTAAYHLRSTRPVTVYQFNPLEYAVGGDCPAVPQHCSFSADASLLLPANALGSDYMVAAWPNAQEGTIAITGTADNTHVTIVSRTATAASNGAPALAAGTPGTITLGARDVLLLAPAAGDPAKDFTGSRVWADRPIEVFGGTRAAYIPSTTCCADHLEESMFPTGALGDTYVVASPAVPSKPEGNFQVVRIVAVEGGTTLTYDPPQPSAPTTLAAAGDFVELPLSAATFQVHASHPILVAQYMTGGWLVSPVTGDPALTLAVPTAQFRKDYLFHAPLSFDSNFVTVIVPTAATVTLDGQPLSGWTAVGASGMEVGRFLLGPGESGNHSISCASPFGIQVYGYGYNTSYWYPGGLDLKPIGVL